MLTFNAGGVAFLCARAPDVPAGLNFEACVSAAIDSSGRGAPDLLYWDGRLADEEGGRWIHFGHGGLDPILAGEMDLSRCVAVSEPVYRRLIARGALNQRGSLGRAAALLARAPTVTSLWCRGLVGAITRAAAGPFQAAEIPASSPEHISLALLVDDPQTSLGPFFDALKGQALSGQIDILIVTHGLGSEDLRRLARVIEASAAADPRVKVRRYSLAGPMGPTYLANIAVGLASHEAVILASAQCVPVTPTVLQHLAGWALAGDAVAACPRIVSSGRLIAAGCGLKQEAGQESSLVLWTDADWSNGLRTSVAPAPGLFAIRRSAWLAAGGMRGTADPAIWTAEFAFESGPKGRTVLLGGEVAEWTRVPRSLDGQPSTPAHRHMNPAAATALCNPDPSNSAVKVPGPEVVDSPRAARNTRPEVWGDPFPSRAGARLLVFCDAYAASQAIPFLEGLKRSREKGSVAVRVIDETAFPKDGRLTDGDTISAIVDAQIEHTQPTVIIASRLGHSGIWDAIKVAVRRSRIPVLFHIDDDLFDLPATLGLERYRRARNPIRLHALYSGLTTADLVLAATPQLATRLSRIISDKRIMWLESGAAGEAGPRYARTMGAPLVIGYMGSASHNHDLAMAVPALNAVLADYPYVEVALFGSIAEQEAAQMITGRLRRYEPVLRDYAGFRKRLAELHFDIGIGPLRDIPFNRVKTPTKWVEYAAAGAATLVSPIGPYRPLVEAGAAAGASPTGWEAGLRRLIEDPTLRGDLVRRADLCLSDSFGWERLEQQVLDALARVSRAGATA